MSFMSTFDDVFAPSPANWPEPQSPNQQQQQYPHQTKLPYHAPGDHNPMMMMMMDGPQLDYSDEAILDGLDMLENRTSIDAAPATPTPERRFQPHSNDVIVGKGIMFSNHPGNVQFHKMVCDALAQYTPTEQEEKETREFVISQVLNQIGHLSPPGKFYKYCANGSWVQVSDFLAKETAAKVIREIRSAQKSNGKTRRRRVNRRRSLDAPNFLKTMAKPLASKDQRDADPFEPIPIQEVFAPKQRFSSQEAFAQNQSFSTKAVRRRTIG